MANNQNRRPKDANYAKYFRDEVNRETLSADKTLSTSDAQIQNLDCGGAARNVDLPAEEEGLYFVVGNRSDAAEAITLRDDAGSTLVTVSQDDVAIAQCDGTGWVVLEGAGAAT